MVYAELMHNPYLLKTKVCFNGQAPKINSQIEKYENQTLKNWVNLVPGIFYDEMNGYDFDLYFTGTRSDFEEIQQAFKKAGVTTEEVRLFFKNELEDAETKSREIDTLLSWMKNRRNRRFDWEKFRDANKEFFDSRYSCVVIGEPAPESDNKDIVIENVKSEEELKGTVLTNTPVLFLVDETSMKQFRQNLVKVLSRKDISQNQLFFLFDDSVQGERTRRIILDLGVDYLQVVHSVNDECIRKYIRSFPMTEYIQESIKLFEKEADSIAIILEEENKECEKQNADIHRKIEALQSDIEKLKSADIYFVERDNFNIPQVFDEIRTEFETKVRKWRNRKTKISGEYEILTASREYEDEVKRCMQSFTERMQTEFSNAENEIFRTLQLKYMEPDIDAQYQPENISCDNPMIPDFPSVREPLMELQVVTYEEPRTDFLGIFKGESKAEKEKVRVVTCYYEQWRERVLEIYFPVVDQYIKEVSDALKYYYENLANAYHVHISELISDMTGQKDSIARQLSDDEQKLQEDNDWLTELQDQLFHIERG